MSLYLKHLKEKNTRVWWNMICICSGIVPCGQLLGNSRAWSCLTWSAEDHLNWFKELNHYFFLTVWPSSLTNCPHKVEILKNSWRCNATKKRIFGLNPSKHRPLLNNFFLYHNNIVTLSMQIHSFVHFTIHSFCICKQTLHHQVIVEPRFINLLL